MHLYDNVHAIQYYTASTLIQRQRRPLRPESLQLRNLLGVQRELSSRPACVLACVHRYLVLPMLLWVVAR